MPKIEKMIKEKTYLIGRESSREEPNHVPRDETAPSSSSFALLSPDTTTDDEELSDISSDRDLTHLLNPIPLPPRLDSSVKNRAAGAASSCTAVPASNVEPARNSISQFF